MIGMKQVTPYEKGLKKQMKRIPRILSLLLCLSLLAGLLAVPAAATSSFSDVPGNEWYAPYVQYAYDNGLMNGVGGGRFDPQGSTTRAMVVTILYRISGSPSTSAYSFGDVPQGQWYSDPISWAANHHVVNGIGGGNFSPNDPVTREQMVTMLYRYANYIGINTANWYSIYDDFTDASSVSSWALDACNWAVAEGIINGVTTTRLDPTSGATRAQIATIMQRFVEGFGIDPSNPQLPSDTPQEEKKPTADMTTIHFDNGQNIQLGMSEAQLLSNVGQPADKLTGAYSGTWYVYNTDNYNDYFAVLVRQGKVYMIYAASTQMSFQGYRIGQTVNPDETEAYAKKINDEYHKYLSYSFQVDTVGKNQLISLCISDESQMPYNPEWDGYPNENDPAATSKWEAQYDTYYNAHYNARPSTAEQLAQESKFCFYAMNAFRAKLGYAPMTWSPVAAATATDHSRFMGTTNNFTHDDPSWPSLVDKLHAFGESHVYGIISENIVSGSSSGLTAFVLWLHSRDHRAGMLLSDLGGVGAYYAENSDGGYYWTSHFYDNTY